MYTCIKRIFFISTILCAVQKSDAHDVISYQAGMALSAFSQVTNFCGDLYKDHYLSKTDRQIFEAGRHSLVYPMLTNLAFCIFASTFDYMFSMKYTPTLVNACLAGISMFMVPASIHVNYKNGFLRKETFKPYTLGFMLTVPVYVANSLLVGSIYRLSHLLR
jgi:hypothetical protein